ncbi:MAG: amino acid adenylation domain-containing protein [Polyangiaceae bacterium]|jgi:amino acid adenylation domain-containing protein|nr:amino acid adenylation domain-containing protein [Polyangiaceae bacterium]
MSPLQNVEDVYPLSPMQRGMLFHSLLSPDEGLYFGQVLYELSGNLDVAAFERAWQRALDRHPALRTAFVWESLDEPLQIVRERAQFVWSHHDWRDGGPERAIARREALLRDDRARGVNLNRAPLMRLVLARVDEARYDFLCSGPHIQLDGWSRQLLLAEVLEAYGAFAAGAPLETTPAPRYREYIAWLERQDRHRASVHWSAKLASLRAPTPLPFGEPETAAAGGEREQSLALASALTTKVKEFARKQRVTLNAVVQAAWALLLARHAGQRDVTFGVTLANRPTTLPDAEATVGLFLNTLPLRLRVDPASTVGELLRGVSAAGAELQEFGHSSLVDVQGWSNVPRGTPLFESIVVFENYPARQPAVEGATHGIELRFAHYSSRLHLPLALLVHPGDGLRFDLTYDARRFDGATAERLLRQLAALLESMSESAERPLGELGLLDAAERDLVLRGGNATATEPEGQPVPALFAAQAARTPEAVALEHDDHTLTYRELDERAEHLAAALRAAGVGPEARVGVRLSRSFGQVVALLAVLKAGGAYVPVDPSYPEARQRFMLDDAGIRVLLTHPGDAALFRGEPFSTLAVDDAGALTPVEGALDAPTTGAALGTSVGAAPEAPAARAALAPTSAAYVLYTSGSTGQPKGVTVSHAALSNLLGAMRRRLGLGASDVIVAATSMSFDIAALELWLPLAIGARVALVSREVAVDGARLGATIEGVRATLMQATPATWQLLIEAGWRGSPQLTALSGGEALPRPLATRLLESCGSLWNLYGPTEATIYSTARRVERGEGRVPIGRPIDNTTAYVLGPNLEPLPIGAPGELYLGGAGLARGYLGRPAATAERFVPNPHATLPGERLYRTGDRARLRPGGDLDFLGRLDDQIKLRGYRIELGEIEATLAAAPNVGACAVVARDDGGEGKRLVAYVVPREGTADDGFTSSLRRRLREALPEYMVPSAFVPLAALPLTPTGKVDRAALPAPDGSRPPLDAEYAPPRNDVEHKVAAIWRQQLGVDRVGAHDNFFELGGHSLLVVRVHGALREEFGRELPMSALFKYPTLSSLAAYLAGHDADADAGAASPAAAGEERAALRQRAQQQRLAARPPREGLPR